jgi:hypothetical protein
MLSFRLPVPLTEGFKIRACHLAKILAQRYTVDLVTFHNGAIPSEQRAQLHTIFPPGDLLPIATAARAVLCSCGPSHTAPAPSLLPSVERSAALG